MAEPLTELPRDALRDVNEQQIIQSATANRVASESQRAEAEADLLTKIVYDNANPSPVKVVLIVIGVLIVVWVLYLLFLKPNATGIWVDGDNNQYRIEHKPFNGSVSVTMNDELQPGCFLSDNLFKCNKNVGVWDYEDIIVFVDGGGLTRVHF